MNHRLLQIIGLGLCLTACAGTIQTASVSEAYKKFGKQNYRATLELITRAENTREMYPEQKAEVTYLKAQTLAALGRIEEAELLFRYIVEQHSNSQYAYLAERKLGDTE